MNTKNALIAKIKIGQKALGLDDATYRAVLQRVTSHDSTTKCSERQLVAVLVEYRNLGWNPTGRCHTGNGKAQSVAPDLKPLQDKIGAQLADLKLPWAYAEGILSRMFKTNLAQATRQQLTACIAALTRQQVRTRAA